MTQHNHAYASECRTCHRARLEDEMFTSRGECILCWQKDGQMDADLAESSQIAEMDRERFRRKLHG